MVKKTKLVLPAVLQRAPIAERHWFAANASGVRLPAGKQILSFQEHPSVMAFPASGSVRVYLVSSEGREMTLYHIRPGGACVLTASCILGGAKFPAMAEVEKEVSGWAVPAGIFREWVARSEFWRQFIFQLLGERLAIVLARLEENCFERIDARLARVLLTGATNGWARTNASRSRSARPAKLSAAPWNAGARLAGLKRGAGA